jgi:hypothetical protein
MCFVMRASGGMQVFEETETSDVYSRSAITQRLSLARDGQDWPCGWVGQARQCSTRQDQGHTDRCVCIVLLMVNEWTRE